MTNQPHSDSSYLAAYITPATTYELYARKPRTSTVFCVCRIKTNTKTTLRRPHIQ